MQARDYADLHALEERFWWFAGMRAITAALLDPLCPPGPDRAVLDAGCGTGFNLGWLERYAGREPVLGVDISEDALNFCRARGHRDLWRASVTALPFGDATFDLVTSFDVLGQLPTPADAEQAVREMHRVLRPGGTAFFRTAAYASLLSGHDAALGTHHRYDRTALLAFVERAGFRPIRSTYANSLLLPVAAFRRLVLKRAKLADAGSDVKPLPRSLNWVDALLRMVLEAEARWMKSVRFGLPAGLSVICAAQKPLA